MNNSSTGIDLARDASKFRWGDPIGVTLGNSRGYHKGEVVYVEFLYTVAFRVSYYVTLV